MVKLREEGEIKRWIGTIMGRVHLLPGVPARSNTSNVT